MGVFTLTIIRHGETQANNQRVIQGHQDTELSDKGVQQAELAGIRLQQVVFTHAYSSDLARAYKTCEIILDKNSSSNCSIIKDSRLRERKFGVFEGRPSEEFRTAAKKHRKSGSGAFPPGGETNKQVAARAREFFQDLCAQLVRELEQETPGAIKRRRHTGSLTCDVFPSSDGNDSGAPGGEEGLTFTASGGKLSPTTTSSTRDSGHSSSGSTSSTSGCDSLTTGGSSEQLSEQASAPSGELPGNEHVLDLGKRGHVEMEPTSDISPSQESSCSSTDDNPTEPSFYMPYDAEIQNVIPAPRTIQYGCPNVSLSPIFEHRLSSISSISSGRNNSFDDGDMVPQILAEVLVVSHGGLIQQLISYLVDNLGCDIHGGKIHALQISPNTGISKFTVTLEAGVDQPVCCLMLHDKDHLIGHEVEPLAYGGEA